MSTYIYKNDCLYADTRKIVNFPKGPMSGTVEESKVLQFPWCYLAFTGFPKSATTVTLTLKILTAMESAVCFSSLLKDHHPELYAILRPKLTRFMALLQSAALYHMDDIGFLAVTRRMVYSLRTGDLKDTERDLDFGYADTMAVVGSSQAAVQILLLNGVAPLDIYPILRRSHTPTGEKPEVFRRLDLEAKVPPWANVDVWSFARAMIKVNIPNKLKEHQESVTDVLYAIAMVGGYDDTAHRNTLLRKPMNAVAREMRTNAHRSTDQYQRLHRLPSSL